jgi:hypothetical protein
MNNLSTARAAKGRKRQEASAACHSSRLKQFWRVCEKIRKDSFAKPDRKND